MDNHHPNPAPPPTSVSEPNKVQTRSNSFIFHIAFYVCLEIIRIRERILGQFTVVFIFSNYTRETDHFTWVLLKRSYT